MTTLACSFFFFFFFFFPLHPSTQANLFCESRCLENYYFNDTAYLFSSRRYLEAIFHFEMNIPRVIVHFHFTIQVELKEKSRVNQASSVELYFAPRNK